MKNQGGVNDTNGYSFSPYLQMVVIIKKGKNVNYAGFNDTKSIYLMKAHIVSSQQTRPRKITDKDLVKLLKESHFYLK